MYPEFLPSDLDGVLDAVEIELSMLDSDLDSDPSGYGVAATEKNYSRLVKKIARLRAALKGAKGGKERRYTRRLARAEKKLEKIQAKLGRQTKRRQSRGKGLRRYQTKLTDAIQARQSAANQRKIEQAHAAAVKAGWPAELRASSDWLGGAKVKSSLYFYSAVYGTWRAAVGMMKQTQAPWPVALRRSVDAIKQEAYRAPVLGFFQRQNATLVPAARAYVSGNPTVIRQGAHPAYPTQAPVLPLQDKLLQLPAMRHRRLALIQQAQQAKQAQMQQMAALQAQQQQAQQAQQMQQANAIAQQRAQLQAQLQAQQAAYAQQLQQMQAQEQDANRSGAFQAFPSSSPMATLPLNSEAQDDAAVEDIEADTEDGEGDSEEGESDESPFYTNPLFIVALLGASALGYKVYTDKKGKGKGKKEDKGTGAPKGL